MTSNGFLLISNRREIKISVVSLTRETGAKRCDFFLVYNCLKRCKIEAFRILFGRPSRSERLK